MNRVVITKEIYGPCFMQVCAEFDVTDEEILEVCNRENPSGTDLGWTRVFREDSTFMNEPFKSAPVACANHAGRTHFIVVC